MASGFNTKEQAECILTVLRARLGPLGMTTVTRGPLDQLPEPPATILVGPSMRLTGLGLGKNEAVCSWIVVLYRGRSDSERRADLVDDWADAVCLAVCDAACDCDEFDLMLADDGPHRRDADEAMYEMLQRMGLRVDPTVVQFSTRREITVP